MSTCLDTTFLIDLLKRRPGAVTRSEQLDEEASPPGVPTPALAEFLQGAYFAGGSYLKSALQLLESVEVLPLTSEIAAEAGRLGADLLKAGTPVDTIDVLIAATAKIHNQVLLTRDSDRLRIPGVLTETY